MGAGDRGGGAAPAPEPPELRAVVRWERLARRSGRIGAVLACTVTIPVFVYVIGYTEENIDDEANNWLLLGAFLVPLAVLVVVHACAHRAWARAVAHVGESGRAELEAVVAERLRVGQRGAAHAGQRASLAPDHLPRN